MRKNRPRIALFAYGEVGCACFDELAQSGANIAALFTHSDDPGEGAWFRSVAEAAAIRGIPTRTDKTLGEDARRFLSESGVELILSCFYRAILPRDILQIPRLGSYNVHGSLLPKYRGRACINWALIHGERETGATLHAMTEYADRGDIVDSETVGIDFCDTAFGLTLKIADASRRLISRSLASIESGCPTMRPQDESSATKFGRRTPADGAIDWSKSALEIYNLTRAVTHPFPGAFTFLGGRKTFIWRARPVADDNKSSLKRNPGEIVSSLPMLFQTGDGLLEVLSLQPEGEAERNLMF